MAIFFKNVMRVTRKRFRLLPESESYRVAPKKIGNTAMKLKKVGLGSFVGHRVSYSQIYVQRRDNKAASEVSKTKFDEKKRSNGMELKCGMLCQ